MNLRDYERDMYIYAERQKGRTFSDIARDLSITANRVRQIYVRTCADLKRPRIKKLS